MKLFLALFLLVILSPVVLAKQQRQEPPSDTGNELRDFATFQQLWKGGALSIDYLLDEQNITDVQRREVMSLCKDVLKQQRRFELDFYKVKLLGSNPNVNEPVWRDKRIEIHRQFMRGLETELLHEQVTGLRNQLRQRLILKSKSCEAFVLPLLVFTKLDIRQSEFDMVQKVVATTKADFDRIRDDLFREALDATFDEISPKSRSQIQELIAFVNELERYPTIDGVVAPTSVANWKDEDFDNLEKEKGMVALINLRNSQVLQKSVDLSPRQLEEMKGKVGSLIEFEAPTEKIDVGLINLVESMPDREGVLTKLKKENREKKHKLLEFRKRIASAVEETLVPRQVAVIEQVAEFSRHLYETGYGDEFGVIVAYFNTVEDSEPSVDEIESARKKYYNELYEARKKACQQVIESLPDETKEKFTGVFGDQLYDYKSELISRWKKPARK